MENLHNGDAAHLNGEGQVSVDGQQIWESTTTSKFTGKIGMNIATGRRRNMTKGCSNNLIFFVNGKYQSSIICFLTNSN